MKKKNLFFLVLSLNLGGTERHIHDLISMLDRSRYSVVICCLFDLGPIGELLRETCPDVRIYHNMIKNKFDTKGIRKLFTVLKHEHIDILYTINSPITQFWGSLFARLKGAVCITRVATTNPSFHANRRKLVNRLMLPFVDIIIAQADIHKAYLVETEGMKEEKVVVIYNGVKKEKYQIETDTESIKREEGIPRNGPVIGIVARLAPEKGHEILLDAARKIVAKFPNAVFLFIGDGKERNRLEVLSQEYGLDGNTVFLGARKDIPQLLSIIDVAVLSSYPVVETFSNAVLEYMAAGKPVVATNSGSTADLVADGESGFVISCGDSRALADSLLTLLNSDELMRSMGKAGIKRVEEKFTLSQMIAEYEKLFCRLMKS